MAKADLAHRITLKPLFICLKLFKIFLYLDFCYMYPIQFRFLFYLLEVRTHEWRSFTCKVTVNRPIKASKECKYISGQEHAPFGIQEPNFVGKTRKVAIENCNTTFVKWYSIDGLTNKFCDVFSKVTKAH